MTDALLQVELCPITFGVPSAAPNHFCIEEKLWLVIAMARSPSFSQIAFTLAAISSSAWSQEISSNFPSPFSPTRFMGFFKRRGWPQAQTADAPRAQQPRCGCEGFGMILTVCVVKGSPFLCMARRPQ